MADISLYSNKYFEGKIKNKIFQKNSNIKIQTKIT